MNTAGQRTLVRLLLFAVAIGVVGMHHLGSPMSGAQDPEITTMRGWLSSWVSRCRPTPAKLVTT